MEKIEKKKVLINNQFSSQNVSKAESNLTKPSSDASEKASKDALRKVNEGKVDNLDFNAEIKKEQESKYKEQEKRKILWRKSSWKKRTISKNNYHLIEVKRVIKVTKGGRRFRFFAVALVGDGKNQVGFGTGKANEVVTAKQKAFFQAEKNMISVVSVNGTIPHKVVGKFCGSKIILKPATQGAGILLGSAARMVVKLSGITDISGKSLGSNNKMNLIRATLNALEQLRTREEVLRLRDLSKSLEV